MARRPSKHLRPARPLSSSFQTGVDKADGRWVVRTVSAGSALKNYVCPHCQQIIAIGVAHIVAWPAEPALLSIAAVDDRRHWHTSCWNRKP